MQQLKAAATEKPNPVIFIPPKSSSVTLSLVQLWCVFEGINLLNKYIFRKKKEIRHTQGVTDLKGLKRTKKEENEKRTN